MAKKDKKPMSLYKKIFLGYIAFLILLIIVFAFYIIIALKNYEKYEVGNFVVNSVAKLSNKDLIDVIDQEKLQISKYDKVTDKKAAIKAIDKTLEDKKKITYELNSESNDPKKPIYDVFYDKKLVLTVKLANKGDVTRIKILNYTKWEVVDIKSHIEDGLYSVKAQIPEDYKLYINGKEVTEKNDSENNITSLYSRYTDIKKEVLYEVTGLIQKPKVEVKTSDGATVKTVKEDGVIKVDNPYFKTDDNSVAQQKLITEFNVLEFAEKYSLFLTADLPGYYHGFNTLSQYLIEDTEMYKVAYDWAHGIDITFTSRHTLKNPAFTDEKLSNFVIYSDKAFSVDVSLKKNMIVTGQDRVMEMNDRMYFVYYNDSWKLLSMEAV
ncbi:MAG: hypothetical protein J5634_00320 [Bacilli bacterium]|nr:hypothetical protein [Bacilli bacterium]